MREETQTKVEAEIKDWQYLAELPDNWHGFQLDRQQSVVDNMYDICAFKNEAAHQSIVLYFHEETNEYKVRLKLGLVEFVRIEFISAKLTEFENLLKEQFETLLQELIEYDEDNLSSIVHKKGILSWEGAEKLPEECEGFSLFVKPQKPTKINNGSYIIIDYVDFDIESDFTIYYNIYRDEFFGEARIWNIPDVNYDFDANTLEELTERLQTGMRPRLKEIRQMAAREAIKHQAKEEQSA